MYQIKNPIIPGFHPDPSVIRVGEDYYVANSTFEWFPGVEIHHSKDLIQWDLICHPLNTLCLLDLRGIINSGGVWAPCLSYDKGVYYLIYSVVRTFDETTQDTDNYLTTAPDIQGPWSEPIYLNSGGFDPSLFHDEDESKWFLNMRWDNRTDKNHFSGIVLQEYSEKEKKLVGVPELIFKGTEIGLTEGPHIYQRKGYYYLMTAEGGTSENHCITMCRSKNRKGPYEIDPENPLLTTKDMNDYPIQYAGHGDIVEAEDGTWYLFHLASRKQLFHGYSVFGRETYMQNVYWNEAGWLRLTDDSNIPKTTAIVPKSQVRVGQKYHFFHKYIFNQDELDIHFSTLRIPLDNTMMSLTERPGYLRLKGRESILSKHYQSLVATRIMEPKFSVITSVDFYPEIFQQMAGLTFFYNTANFYYVYISYDENKGKSIQLMKRESRKTKFMIKEPIALPDEGEVLLKGDFTAEGLHFYYRMREQISDVWHEIIPDDNEILSVYILSDEYANVCGEQGFTGSFVGVCCQDLTGRRESADFAFLDILES